MSFGTNRSTSTAENNLSGTSNAALNTLLPAETSAGSGLLGVGGNNVSAGTNYFNTLLNGNSANTAATLAPSINQIQGGTANTLNAVNTLMPRGGGRSSALFGQSFAPQSQIQGLFNNARTTAATTLPQIGLQQEQLGGGLFGLGNQSLSAATGANSSLGSLGLQQQQINNQLFGGLGAGLFGLGTTPFGGGSASNGLLGLI
jgi:hypothetical protein